MPKVSSVYSGDYVTATELPTGRRITAIVTAVAVEAVGQEQQQKVVLELQNPNGRAWPRRLVLNKTNALILSSAFGDDTVAWPNRAIEIWAEPVNFQGRIVQGIRLNVVTQAPANGNGAHLPVPTTAAPASPGRPGSAAPMVDDEIPW